MAAEIISKTCRTCKETKPLSEFYKATGNQDGFSNRCKICKLANQKQYRQSEKGKAVIKHYFQSEKGKSALKRYHQSVKGKMIYKHYRQSEKGKARNKRYKQSEKGKAAIKLYNIHHSEQSKARDAINNAIRDGQLPRPDFLPCHYCPVQAKQYHHHKGYEPEHWLDVVPVCIKCHNKIPENPVRSTPSLTA